MTKYLLSILLVASAALASAVNTVSLSNISGHPGDVVEVIVCLENTDKVSGVQFELPLTKYIQYVDQSCTLIESRQNGHSLYASCQDNVLRVIIADLQGRNFNGSEGALFRFSVKLGSEPLNQTLSPTVQLGVGAGNSVSCTASGCQATINCPKAKIENIVSFERTPIYETSYCFLTIQNEGNETLVLDRLECDNEYITFEGVGEIAPYSSRNIKVVYSPQTVENATGIISVYSNHPAGVVKKAISLESYSRNYLYWDATDTDRPNDWEVVIGLENTDDVYGIQLELELPDGAEYTEGSAMLNGQRCSGFVSSVQQDGNTLTILAYSPSRSPLQSKKGDVLSLRINGDKIKSQDNYISQKTMVATDINGKNILTDWDSNLWLSEVKSPGICVNAPSGEQLYDMTRPCTIPVTITSCGTGDLTVTGISYLSEGYSTDTSCPFTIPQGQSKTVNVLHQATTAGTFSTTMQIYSNDVNNRLTSVVLKGVAYEPDSLFAAARYNSETNDYTVSLSLENYSAICGVQFDINVPNNGISCENLLMTTRMNGLSHMMTKVSDTKYRVVIYSFNKTAVKGNSGEILSFKVKGTDLENKQICIDRITLSSVGGQNLCLQEQLSLELEPTYILGDVTGNGVVSIQDLTVLVSYLKDRVKPNLNIKAADVNQDGSVNVLDVKLLQNIILGIAE